VNPQQPCRQAAPSDAHLASQSCRPHQSRPSTLHAKQCQPVPSQPATQPLPRANSPFPMHTTRDKTRRNKTRRGCRACPQHTCMQPSHPAWPVPSRSHGSLQGPMAAARRPTKQQQWRPTPQSGPLLMAKRTPHTHHLTQVASDGLMTSSLDAWDNQPLT
jgi:hypothetical protein